MRTFATLFVCTLLGCHNQQPCENVSGPCVNLKYKAADFDGQVEQLFLSGTWDNPASTLPIDRLIPAIEVKVPGSQLPVTQAVLISSKYYGHEMVLSATGNLNGQTVATGQLSITPEMTLQISAEFLLYAMSPTTVPLTDEDAGAQYIPDMTRHVIPKYKDLSPRACHRHPEREKLRKLLKRPTWKHEIANPKELHVVD